MRRVLGTWIPVAVVLAALVLPVSAGKPQPPPPPGPADIAYGSRTLVKPSGVYGGDLTFIDRDGSNKRVVYRSGRVVRAPDWSHDGRYVAFSETHSLGIGCWIQVLEVSSGKVCYLTMSYTGDACVMAPKFHPLYGSDYGDGRYVIAYTDWIDLERDLYTIAFHFQEGTCAVIPEAGSNPPGYPPGRRMTFTPGVDELGAAWSPSGDRIATRVLQSLMVYDVLEDSNGSLVLSSDFEQYSLGTVAGFGTSGSVRSLQWSFDPTRLALKGDWPVVPGTMQWDIFEFEISADPALAEQITNTPGVENYFDYAPGGGMVIGRDYDILLLPGETLLATTETNRKGIVKWPLDPAWNPTRQ